MSARNPRPAPGRAWVGDIARRRDCWAGMIFVAAGLVAVWVARRYPMGTAARMGPGYFPTVLGGVLAVLGLAVALRGLLAAGGRVGRLALRPAVLVAAAVVAFALLARSAGLAVATLAVVGIGALAGWDSRPREVVALGLLLAGLAVGVFVYGLGLPFRAWPW